MPEEKRKLNAWLPVSLYNKLESAGYNNITQALIKALESSGEDPQEDITGYIQDIEGYKKDIAGYKQDIAALTVENDKLKEDIAGYYRIQEGHKQDIDRIQAGYKEDLSRIQKDLDKQNQDIIGYTRDIKALNNEIEKLKEDLKRAPNLVEFAQLQAKNEALKMILEEKDKRIDSLENDLKKADLDKEDLKAMYNNYFLQVQTLINQKAIGTGSTKKERKTAARKEAPGYSSVVQEYKEKPDIEPEKGPIEKICKYCGKTFYTDNMQKEYCSKEHKDQAYNEKRRKEREYRKNEVSG